MFAKIYKSTIQTTLRNPAILLSLIAVGLLWYNGPKRGFAMVISQTLTPYDGMVTVAFNWIYEPLMSMLPTFAAVVCSVGILQDKKNRFYDIEKVTGMKTLTYYLGKLAAFTTVCYAVLILTIAGWIVFGRLFGLSGWTDAMSVPDFLTRVLRNTVVCSIPTVLIYISIPVSASLLTGSAAAGIASGVVYSLIGMVFGTRLYNGRGGLFGNYLYPISWKIISYMFYYDSVHFAEHIKFVSPTINYRTSFGEVVLSYVLTLAMSLTLLTAGYIALKRKES